MLFTLFILIFGIWTQNFKGQGHLGLLCYDSVFSLTVLHFLRSEQILKNFLFSLLTFLREPFIFGTCTYILYVSACTLSIMA